MIEGQTMLPPYEHSFIEELHLLGSEVFGERDRKELSGG